MGSQSNPGSHENTKANPTQIAKALKGIDLPKSKQELVDYARSQSKESNPDVIRVLEQLPDRQYTTMADVEKGVGQAQ